MRDQSWPADRVEMLRKLWAEGETAVVIAARLGGLSRSAVLGKIFRLRLGADSVATSGKSKATAVDVGVRRGDAPVRRRRRRLRQPQIAPQPARQHKTLFELTNETCRWPHGRPGTARFFFCGAPEADLARGRPYCIRHMLRAYSPCVSIGSAEPAIRPGLQETRR